MCKYSFRFPGNAGSYLRCDDEPINYQTRCVLLDSEEALERLFTALVNYRESHQRPLVIVHGGGCVVDELMKGLNLPVKKKNGLRVTPADQIDIITGALAGTANKTLLAWAKKHHIASVGLYLGDGDSVKVTQLDEELGHVGLAQRVRLS